MHYSMIVPESVKKDWVPPVDELTNIKIQLDEERTLHETTRTQLRNTQTELEVAKIKLLNIEARMSILEANFSKVNV